MMRLVCILLLLNSCGLIKQPPPSSICETEPETISKWNGQVVHWRGVIVDASPHGMYFAGECGRGRGMPIISLPTDAKTEALQDSLDRHAFDDGAMKIDIRAEITEGALKIVTIEEFKFLQMNKQRHTSYWNDMIGQPGMEK